MLRQAGDDAAIELYSIDKERLLEMCEIFPRTAAVLQQTAIEQIKHLS